jgi:hypothetical protein
LTGVLFVGAQWGSSQEDKDMAGSTNPSSATEPHPAYTNRLASETSPYLLQHAHNPVDWYPWGEEAFRRARETNRPIFLSVGYSACHWCHVMERESFEDPATARILNEHFISIKVDREERPDVDEIYMTAVQMMTGRGGWPMSVFLTPDRKPFFGGTYFPPEDRLGMPSFKKVLSAVSQAWKQRRGALTDNAEQVVRAIESHAAPAAAAAAIDESLFEQAAAHLRREFDARWGGFGGAPKFPPSGAIAVLFRQHLQTGESDLLEMATLTLDRMAAGGMYDQIGGGFHRYSVDERWLVPHFEKMLYDNAILARVYLEAWQATGNPRYRRVAEETLDYVLRDMTDGRGGFHSAEDADSEGEEGKFYVWTRGEIFALLGDEEAEVFCDYYGASDAGNFEGKNVLHVAEDPAGFARRRDLSDEELEARLAPLRQKLLAARAERARPGKDDKILAAWNGMMVSALAKGYQVLGEPRYREAAERAADFILAEMVRDGVLLRSYRAGDDEAGEGTAKLPGYLDDYAEVASSLVDLYEATFDLRRLVAAETLTAGMVADFWDAEQGGFFYTSADHKHLLVRTKPFYDGAVPSGNSVAALLLLRLAKLRDRPEFAGKAEAILSSMEQQMAIQPRAYLNLLSAADFRLRPVREIAVVGDRSAADTRRLLEVIHTVFLPNTVVALLEPGAPDHEAARRLVPLLAEKTMIDGKATVYVCQNYTCLQPVSDPSALEQMLQGAP